MLHKSSLLEYTKTHYNLLIEKNQYEPKIQVAKHNKQNELHKHKYITTVTKRTQWFLINIKKYYPRPQ